MPRRPSTRTPAQVLAARRAGARKGVKVWAEMRAAAAGTVPAITPALAARFVKLLGSGLPPIEAMLQVAPQQVASFRRNAELMNKWVAYWMEDGHVQAEIERGNGGPWESLSLEKRLDLALNHSFSQLAYFLYTTDFTQITDSATLKKLMEAREAVTTRTQGGKGSEDELQSFMRDLTDRPDAGPLRFVPKPAQPERTEAVAAGRTDTRSVDVRTGTGVDLPGAEAARQRRPRPANGPARLADKPHGSGRRLASGNGGPIGRLLRGADPQVHRQTPVGSARDRVQHADRKRPA